MTQSDKDYHHIETDQWGTKRWFLQYRFHRIDGPAIEYSDGTNMWYSNGFLHRIDGPAIEYSNGTKEWYVNGELHRIDGPAVEGFDGFKAWWLNDYQMDFEDWKIVVRRYYDTDEDYLLMLLKLD